MEWQYLVPFRIAIRAPAWQHQALILWRALENARRERDRPARLPVAAARNAVAVASSSVTVHEALAMPGSDQPMISMTAQRDLENQGMVAAVCRAPRSLAPLTLALRSNDFQHS
jgi:hypothetical protein